MIVYMDINQLANEIRRVDGNHDLGAGALAEALCEFIDDAIGAAWADGARRSTTNVLDAVRRQIDLLDPSSPEPCDACFLIGPTVEYGMEEIGYFSDLGSAAEARANHVDNGDWKIWVALYDTEYGGVIEGSAKLVVF